MRWFLSSLPFSFEICHILSCRNFVSAILLAPTIVVTLVGTVVIFFAPSMLVFARWHHGGKKFKTGTERAQLFVAIWFLHRVSQLNVTRIVGRNLQETLDSLLIISANLWCGAKLQSKWNNDSSLFAPQPDVAVGAYGSNKAVLFRWVKFMSMSPTFLCTWRIGCWVLVVWA